MLCPSHSTLVHLVQTSAEPCEEEAHSSHRSDIVQGAYISEASLPKHEIDRGIMRRRRTSPPLVSQTDILVKIVSVSLGMINVTSLSCINSKSKELIVCPLRKQLMDAYEQTPHTV